MSIKVMSLVWSRAPVQNGELLVLLALADNADDHGNAFPGVPYLASKARMSDRNVQLCMRKLERARLIRVVPRGGPSGANLYCINLQILRDLPDDYMPSKADSDQSESISPVKNSHPVKSGAEGVKCDASDGEIHFTQTSMESSIEPSSLRVPRQARERDEVHAQNNNGRSDFKVIKRDFEYLTHEWPSHAGMSLVAAEREFFKLSPEIRESALLMRDAWLALLRRQGKEHIPGPATYLKERLWEHVPSSVPESASSTIYAEPYSQQWIMEFLRILESPPAKSPPPSAFEKARIEQGGEIGSRVLLERQAKFGWEAANEMLRRAEDGKGIHIRVDEAKPLREMKQVAIHSREFQEWRSWYAERGRPWLQPPKSFKWIWLPAGGPGCLPQA